MSATVSASSIRKINAVVAFGHAQRRPLSASGALAAFLDRRGESRRRMKTKHRRT